MGVTITGSASHATAQALKIETISITLVAIAPKNGQIEFAGEASRASGTASATVLITSSRRSTRNPDAPGGSGSSHSGLAPDTTGIRAKF
jgi:hypothetical protein